MPRLRNCSILSRITFRAQMIFCAVFIAGFIVVKNPTSPTMTGWSDGGSCSLFFFTPRAYYYLIPFCSASSRHSLNPSHPLMILRVNCSVFSEVTFLAITMLRSWRFTSCIYINLPGAPRMTCGLEDSSFSLFLSTARTYYYLISVLCTGRFLTFDLSSYLMPFGRDNSVFSGITFGTIAMFFPGRFASCIYINLPGAPGMTGCFENLSLALFLATTRAYYNLIPILCTSRGLSINPSLHLMSQRVNCPIFSCIALFTNTVSLTGGFTAGFFVGYPTPPSMGSLYHGTRPQLSTTISTYRNGISVSGTGRFNPLLLP